MLFNTHKTYYNASMRLIVQRVKKAELSVNNEYFSGINYGLVVYVGFKDGDSEKEIEFMIKKLINLRIFPDENYKMNLSVSDISGDLMLVSNFSLYADCTRGNRPNFMNALSGDKSVVLYDKFVERTKEVFGGKVQTGMFGEHMEINQLTDGPINIILDSDNLMR